MLQLRGCFKANGPIGYTLGKLLSIGCFSTCLLHAGPAGERVVAGSAQFQRAGNETTIEVSDNTIIHFESFSLSSEETLRFHQPSSDSKVLNRVTGSQPSHIDGKLFSNGQVYILNPAGIFFGKQAVVNTGALFAVAGKMEDADFFQGVNRFTDLSASVVNEGYLRAETVALIAKQISQHGRIVAKEGTALCVAGKEVWIRDPQGLVFASLAHDSQDDVGIDSTGHIDAGDITLAAQDAFSLAIRHKGRLDGKNVYIEAGKKGAAKIEDASINAPGGSITVVGDKVGVYNSILDVGAACGGGTILLGGNYQGKGPLPNASVVIVDDQSRLLANAFERGDAGQVVLWSDVYTFFNGCIEAAAYGASGNGGFVETSSKGNLHIPGHAKVSTTGAAGCKGGMWLLDPLSVTLKNPPADVTAPPINITFDTSPNEQITVAYTALSQSTTSITIEADAFIQTTDLIPALTLGVSGDCIFRSNSIIFTIPLEVNSGSLLMEADLLSTKAITINDANVTLRAGTSIFCDGDVTIQNATQPSVFSSGQSIAITGNMVCQKDLTLQGGSSGSLTIGAAGSSKGINVSGGALRVKGFGSISFPGGGQIICSGSGINNAGFIYIDPAPLQIGGNFILASSFSTFFDGSLFGDGDVVINIGAGSTFGGAWGPLGGSAIASSLTVGGAAVTFNGPIITKRGITLQTAVTFNKDVTIQGANPGSNFANNLTLGNMTLRTPSVGLAIGVSSSNTLTVTGNATIELTSGLSPYTIFSTIQGPGVLRCANGAADLNFYGPLGVPATPLGGIVTTGVGPITFYTGEAYIQGNAAFNSSIILDNPLNFVVNGGNLNFNGNFVSGPYDLTISGSSNVLFGAQVDLSQTGAEAGNLSVATSGNITAQQTISTTTDGSYAAGNVSLISSAGSVQVNEIDARAGSPSFDGNITLQPSTSLVNGGLSLRDRRPQGILTITGDLYGKDISLSAQGRAAVPSVATIASSSSGNNITIQADNLTVGPNELFSVLGSLTINASSSASLSDISAIQGLSVSAPVLTLYNRPAAYLLANDGNLYYSFNGNYVTGDSLDFTSESVVSQGPGEGIVFLRQVANPSGESDLASFPVQQLVSPITNATLLFNATVLTYVLPNEDLQPFDEAINRTLVPLTQQLTEPLLVPLLYSKPCYVLWDACNCPAEPPQWADLDLLQKWEKESKCASPQPETGHSL